MPCYMFAHQPFDVCTVWENNGCTLASLHYMPDCWSVQIDQSIFPNTTSHFCIVIIPSLVLIYYRLEHAAKKRRGR